MMWVMFSSQTWQNYARYCLQAPSKDWKGRATIKSKTVYYINLCKLDSIVSVSFWLDDTINWTFHFDPKFGQDYLSP